VLVVCPFPLVFLKQMTSPVTLLLSDNDTCKTSRLSLSTKHRWGWYTLHIVAFRERRFAFSVAMYMALVHIFTSLTFCFCLVSR
jgi:hypothetical protein